MRARLAAIGPGALAAAAFIGPGTVTTATLAGARFGYELIWALGFATLAAIALHEMAARLGVAARMGLGEAVMAMTARAPAVRMSVAVLIVAALMVGNAAYQGGNISGAALGVEAVAPGAPRRAVVAAVSLVAAALVLFGGYRLIERALVGVVLFMSVAFLAALIAVRPDFGALAAGFAPSLPEGGGLLALGLVGTTIVPYNLFLHAAAARTRWAAGGAGDDGETIQLRMADARLDAGVSIGVGGVVSMAILATAAASLGAMGVAGGEVASAADMARRLAPAFGPAATALVAAGLFAAGLSSAVTAPLAAGYAASELFGWKRDPSGTGFRLVAAAVLAAGAAAALSGAAPVSIIIFAQFANGLLLPLIGAFLLYAVNQRALLGDAVNGPLANLVGAGVLLATAALGARSLAAAFARL